MKEIWKDIKGFEQFYQASNLGHIRSLSRFYIGHRGALTKMKGRLLGSGNNGYIQIHFSINGETYNSLAHILIAKTFIPNPKNKPYVNHINGIKSDNRVENLEWVTPRENDLHASRNGLKAFGERNGFHKLTNKLIKEIRSKYIPLKYTNRMLAKEYNMSYHEIQLITSGKRWKHIL